MWVPLESPGGASLFWGVCYMPVVYLLCLLLYSFLFPYKDLSSIVDLDHLTHFLSSPVQPRYGSLAVICPRRSSCLDRGLPSSSTVAHLLSAAACTSSSRSIYLGRDTPPAAAYTLPCQVPRSAVAYPL
ncbi:hypothetical protein E3N88_16816 [Mikania micrantha]|uniref:Uncharacterized protein n=1 Tax=Mikania micrantha TaxID=192012 RepID=A0A5N6NRL5_9ASTR|nr:hypothetical protein E3N88_16816 [Mikania micrantha]